MTLDTITQQDVPCMLIASFPYENACNTYRIKFYNSTPTLIGETDMDDYTGTDLCNTTFNFTEIGSYTFNISSGDSGRLIVEVDEDMMLAIILVLVFVGVIFMGIGFYLFFKRLQ